MKGLPKPGVNLGWRQQPESLIKPGWSQFPILGRIAGNPEVFPQPPYAVARCCSWLPRRTLTTLEMPGSCMVTP